MPFQGGVMKSKGKNFWIYVIHKDHKRQTAITGRMYDGDWMRLDTDGTLTIKATPEAGYAWDGCTPKRAVLELVWGGPDGVVDCNTEKRKAYYAYL